MKRKVLLVLIFFILFFTLKVGINYKFQEAGNNSKNTSYIPISQSLNNFYSSTLETLVIDNKITDFITEWDIKGASVAVSKDGRLVYAKGFGFADFENEEPVMPKHLFRIASVSKLITAVAIMKLHEQGRLSLEAPVFGEKGILNQEEFLHYQDEKVALITVRHLLHHTGGWNGKKPDPVFMPLHVARTMHVDPPVDEDITIRYMLENRELDHDPGYIYSYSNFGYMVLGRVIEEITRMEYEDYVKFSILQPLGIYDMKIGTSFMEERDSNEVVYYETKQFGKSYAYDGSGRIVPNAYGAHNLKVLGAAGGWIASAAELMKLIVAIDGHDDKRDILKKETIEVMTTPDKFGNSLIGWRGSDGFGTWWRTGTLSGTGALVMRQTNNINWVVLLNTSTRKKSHIHNEISSTMFSTLSIVNEWPQYDLFQYKVAKDGNFLASIQ
jgi:CubicO group peptidase (beta-lactamase class C family)